MKTLEYYYVDGTYVILENYSIDTNGVVTNIITGRAMARHKNSNGYNVVSVRYEEKQRQFRVARAIASTFLGKPPTIHHTADHIDRTWRAL